MNPYFDHNATTPLCAAAREAWLEASDRFWHNPSSLYREAGAAKRRLEEAREELADRLGCEPSRVVFTGGATEGNQGVMRQAAERFPAGRALISAVEHPSVREPALREFGPGRVVQIPQTDAGTADAGWIEDFVRSSNDVALVSLMAANNETGVLQPWRKAAAICRGAGVWFHADAAQWIGKLPMSELAAQCDLVTGCAHKFGGPKGTGFLIIPGEAEDSFRSLVGGPQEAGHRAGTEDLPGILAMMAALGEKSDDFLALNRERWLAERDRFVVDLAQRLPGLRLVGESAERLWNTAMLVLPGAESNLKWLTRLSARGFAVSTGSACSAGKGAPSRVMAAMGLDFEEMGRVIRVSGGWETTVGDWDALAEAFAAVAADLTAGNRRGGGLAG
jgi:cysteine desulfurase